MSPNTTPEKEPGGEVPVIEEKAAAVNKPEQTAAPPQADAPAEPAEGDELIAPAGRTNGEFEFGDTYYLQQKVDYVKTAANAASGGCCACLGNQFTLRDEKGVVFTIVEDSWWLTRCLCNPTHKMELQLYEGKNTKTNPTYVIYRRGKPCGFCPVLLDCCRDQIVLKTYNGENEGIVLATVKQPLYGGIFTPEFQVWEGDASNDEKPVYTILGPSCCVGGLLGEFINGGDFAIHHSNKAVKKDDPGEGLIKKDSPQGASGIGDMAVNLLTDADNFSIHMPADASNEARAGILAASLLIDYLFFELNGNVRCEPLSGGVSCACCNLVCCGDFIPCRCEVSKDCLDWFKDVCKDSLDSNDDDDE